MIRCLEMISIRILVDRSDKPYMMKELQHDGFVRFSLQDGLIRVKSIPDQLLQTQLLFSRSQPVLQPRADPTTAIWFYA